MIALALQHATLFFLLRHFAHFCWGKLVTETFWSFVLWLYLNSLSQH